MKDDEEVPSETQMQKISLEEGGGGGGDGGGGSSAKKTKTRFTQEQKEKMTELGQTLGWRIQNHNEAAIKQFCDETGVKRHAFKGWLYNTKYALARDASSESSTKKRTTKFTEEQKDKMLEFGQRLGWRIKKHNEADVQQFCDETGVKLQTFRVWMYNTKHALTRAAYSGCGGSSWKKKFSRTKFTKEQKDKMREFGERLGWRILKKDMAVVEQFCEETAGVKPHSLMFWVKNKRHTHGYKSQEGRPDSQSKINEVETRKRHLEAETNRCSEESKFRETMTCHELSVDLENKKMECIAVQDEYRDGMKEWITCLDYQKVISETAKEKKRAHERITNLCITRLKEDKKVICEREKRVQERIAYSEEESGKTGRDDIEKYVLLKTENIDLECSKRRVGDEIEAHKKMFCDLETRVFRMEEENSTLRCMESQLGGNIELELRGLQNEVSHNDESEIRVKDRDKMSKLQAKITTTGTNSSQMVHLQTKEKMLHTNEQIQASAFPDSRSINMLCEPSIDVEEKEKNTPLESKVEFRYNVRKQQVLELDGSSNQRQSVLEPSSVRPASDVHTIEISDSDDSLERSRDSENDLTSKKCLKRICLGQRDEGYGSSCKKDFPFMLIQKPKRASRIVSSDSESKEDVEEQQDKVPKRSPSNLCSETCNVSCRGKNVEKMNGWAERTSQNERTSPNHLETSGMAYDKVGKSAEDGKERKNRVEEVGSDSDGRSLSGIILEGSGSLDTDSVDSFSDSEDSEDFQSALDKAFAMILRRKDKELKWKFEVDMLYSFEEDPELCMKAVCALYRQQTSQEKPRENFLQYNNRGFDKFDALRGTTLAEFLMDGDRKGDLKKSVKELEMFDPKALEECKRLARHYSEQLFTIYQNKEDPFFLPSSTGC